MFERRPVTFVNAAVIAAGGRIASTLRVRRGRIDGIDVRPASGDLVVDAGGAVITPGLINAHDHLELNSFQRLKWRAAYANVREWIADFQPRFGVDPALADARPETLRDRLWVGGLKNLLSGVTTVGHHNPLYAPLRRGFPVRVMRRFGISHSLQIDGERVAESYRRTRADWPWIVHAAEGVDAEARAELATLRGLCCVGPNTVFVHGVAFESAVASQALQAGASLVWCPTSNHFLFGATADVRLFEPRQRLALGTDSRLSGEGDLLDELRHAAATRQLSAEALVRCVTAGAATVLRLRDAGVIAVGRAADLTVLRRRACDPFTSVVSSRRADVQLTMIAGEPVFGHVDMQVIFAARRQRQTRVSLDGAERLLASWIARRVTRLKLQEPGLEVR